MEYANKSKLTLVIDGNWLLMSRLFPLLSKNRIDYSLLTMDLQLLLIRSINIVLRTFPSIDNIIFCSDGGSWRNSLPVPDFIEDEYKGNRNLDETIDWNVIFDTFGKFSKCLEKSGITVCHEPGVEGDDWCWYWSQKLNKEETNVILWTRDHDVTQLVKTDANGFFTVWWNKDDGIIAEDVTNREMNYLFNNMYNDNEKIFESLINASTNIKYINPSSIYVDKIIRGDAGDNVFPIITKQAKTRVYKVSRKDIDTTLDVFDDNAVENYLANLVEQKQYKGKIDQKDLNNIVEHFKYNKRLVVLDESIYPEDILYIFREYDEKNYNVSKDTTIAESEILAKKNDIEDILETI